MHDIIYQELCLGEIKSESRDSYVQIIANLHEQGAQAVILGCTEIALLVKQSDTSIPLYDTTEIHAARGVEWALGS
nr:aspartate/glutamate racemase family protein [uncultured Vibrio sp.]